MNKGKDVSDLKSKELDYLSTIRTVSKVKFLEAWDDDHEQCARVSFHSGKKKWDLNFWWSGYRFIGHALYANDCPKAKSAFLTALREEARTAIEDIMDEAGD